MTKDFNSATKLISFIKHKYLVEEFNEELLELKKSEKKINPATLFFL